MNLLIEQLEFSYPASSFCLRIDRFEVRPGQACGIRGESGSGKTTLLHLAAGIRLPQSGRVRHGELDLSACSDAQRRRHRLRNLGVVFQTLELLPYLPVEENVLLSVRLGPGRFSLREERERARELLSRLELWHRRRDKPEGLSQGERQRVAIARALIARPKVLLADEPTSSLAPRQRDQAIDLLCQETQARSALLLVASHDERVLERLEPGLDLAARQPAFRPQEEAPA